MAGVLLKAMRRYNVQKRNKVCLVQTLFGLFEVPVYSGYEGLAELQCESIVYLSCKQICQHPAL